MPVKAGQSEIIQASEKDDEYKSFLRNYLGEFVRDVTGILYISITNFVLMVFMTKLYKIIKFI